ncbi:MAG: CRISPR-associated helicase Cas3' [Mariprofundales bacterium]
MEKQTYFAHTANKNGDWHKLDKHLKGVSKLSEEFASEFFFHDEARLAGLLHDLGKYGYMFQERLHGKESGIDHWSAGAWIALVSYRSIAAAMAIQGHHIGLQILSKTSLKGLHPKKLIQNHPLQLRLSTQDYSKLEQYIKNDIFSIKPPEATIFKDNMCSRLNTMLDIRMLFSTLVDADFLDTEAHFQGTSKGKSFRKSGPALNAEKALLLLENHIQLLPSKASDTVLKVRKLLLSDCLDSATASQGTFTLTAPTGSGKTLAMLAFALKHAVQHQLKRIVLVIPYLSIIEQTAAIYREIFESEFEEDYIIEHHSLAGGGAETEKKDNETRDIRQRRHKLLAENWDAPIIITTSVQMLESLFSNRPSRCRKLHRLSKSIILFDEVQTLPVSLAIPSLAALSHLASTYASSIVFATATQPAFSHLHEQVQLHCKKGWNPREIVSDVKTLFAPMQRVIVRQDKSRTWAWEELAQELPESCLCIVNLKRHAFELWKFFENSDCTWHLSTQMCPAHRSKVLETIKKRLGNNEAVRLISTQCVEAGVDVDFPVVYRAHAPLDAIVQAAGRCNRNGNGEKGSVIIFTPEDERYPPGAYQQASQITRLHLKSYEEEVPLDDPAFISEYYRTLYDISRPDSSEKNNNLFDLIKAGNFPEISKHYSLINQDAINVLVPYAEKIDEYNELCAEAESEDITGDWMRRARNLSISLFRPTKDEDPFWGYVAPVFTNNYRQDQNRSSYDAQWYIYTEIEHYHEFLGFVPPKNSACLIA